ncbi:RH14 [Symbiodinium natans]|uniref:RH14 protein n=1 Tax=Symbiodinium natans TaxID=878477 RepID=A0A812N0J1_9DINO|nr:RH14 [Symbiodinium natans]
MQVQEPLIVHPLWERRFLRESFADGIIQPAAKDDSSWKKEDEWQKNDSNGWNKKDEWSKNDSKDEWWKKEDSWKNNEGGWKRSAGEHGDQTSAKAAKW